MSFGADITTWVYIKYIKETGQTGLISQPCPAIVNYIEHYQPMLIKQLMPIQSPMICEAIYLKKYQQQRHCEKFVCKFLIYLAKFSQFYYTY